MFKLFGAVSLQFLAMFGSVAYAADVRAGLMFQDIEIQGIGGVKGKESGNALTLDIVLDSPEFLEWTFKPRPYIGGSLNISGDTSYGGAGLLWDTELFDRVTGEIAFGLVAHNGTLEIPSPGEASTPEQALEFDRRNREEIEFGSRLLFRTQFAAGYQVTDSVGVQLVYEHLSHGKILSNGSNEGLNSLGVRFSTKF